MVNEKVIIEGGKRIYEARKAIVMNGGKILLCKLNLKELQLGHKASLGTWEVVGGRMQIGDTDEDTLRREIKEEAGIDAEVERELTTFEFSPREDVIIRGKCFLCRPLSLDVRLNDAEKQHEEYRWVSLDEALKYDIAPFLRDAIIALKKG